MESTELKNRAEDIRRPTRSSLDTLLKRRTKAEDYFSGPSFTPRGTAEEIKRQNVVSALLDDELSFAQSLELLVDLYLDPLRYNELMTKEELNIVFFNLETIWKHSETLSGILKDAIMTIGISDFMIGLCFRMNIEMFDDYVKYMGNFRRVSDALDHMRERKARLREFLDDTSKIEDLKGKTLLDFLRLPLARLKQYQKSFKEMVINTMFEHADFHNLLYAYASFTRYIFRVEERYFKGDNLRRIEEIDWQIERTGINSKKADIPDTLVDEKRILVREGNLIKTNVHGRKQERYVFAFNDSLLYAVVKEKAGNTYIFPKGRLPMKKLVMKRHFTNKSHTRQTIELRRMDSSKAYRFTAETSREGSYWREDLESLIHLAHEGDMASDLGDIPYFDIPGDGYAEEVSEVQRKIMSNDVNLINEKRWIIRQGMVIVKDKSANVSNMCHMVLFNDSLLCARENEAGKWIVLFFNPLHYLLLEESKEEISVLLVNMHDNAYQSIFFRSGLHKFSWVKSLSDCIVSFIETFISKAVPSELGVTNMQYSVRQSFSQEFGNRKLVKEGRVTMEGKNSQKHITLFLFEDCLVFTREYMMSTSVSQNVNCMRYQPMSVLSSQDWIIHSLQDCKFNIVSMTNADITVLKAISAEDRDDWVDILNKIADGEVVEPRCKYISFVAQDRENGDMLVYLARAEDEGSNVPVISESDDLDSSQKGEKEGVCADLADEEAAGDGVASKTGDPLGIEQKENPADTQSRETAAEMGYTAIKDETMTVLVKESEIRPLGEYERIEDPLASFIQPLPGSVAGGNTAAFPVLVNDAEIEHILHRSGSEQALASGEDLTTGSSQVEESATPSADLEAPAAQESTKGEVPESVGGEEEEGSCKSEGETLRQEANGANGANGANCGDAIASVQESSKTPEQADNREPLDIKEGEEVKKDEKVDATALPETEIDDIELDPENGRNLEGKSSSDEDGEEIEEVQRKSLTLEEYELSQSKKSRAHKKQRSNTHVGNVVEFENLTAGFPIPENDSEKGKTEKAATLKPLKRPENITPDSSIKEILEYFPGQKVELLPTSKLILHDLLIKENVHGRKQERRVFLFNDRIIYAKETRDKAKGVKFVLKGNVPTGQFLVRNLHGIDTAFALMRLDIPSRKEIRFYCRSPEVKSKWVSSVSDALRALGAT